MIWIVPALIGGAAAGAVVLALGGKKTKRASGRSSSASKHPRSMRGRFIPSEVASRKKPTKQRAPKAKGPERHVRGVTRGFKPTVMVHSQFGGADYPAKIVEDIGEGYVQVVTKSGSRWEEPKANVRKWKRGDPLEES